MQGLLKALISYILDKLEDVSSASLESGFQRLLEKFQGFFKQDQTGFSFLSKRSDSSDEEFTFNPGKN